MSNLVELIENEEYIDIGDTRAIDYYDAVDWGLEPESYTRDIPIGVHNLKLMFKTWGKKNSLNCFFKDINTNKKYRITVFSSYKIPYQYKARDNNIDFSESGNLGNIYQITTKNNPKGYSIMISVNLLNTI